MSDAFQIILINFLVNSILYYLRSLMVGIQSQGFEGVGAVLLSQFLFNFISYLVLVVALPILGNQGTLDNVKKKLLKEKKEREYEQQYYSHQYNSIDNSKK